MPTSARRRRPDQRPRHGYRHNPGIGVMHDARLGDRLRPHGVDRGGQTLESVADHHADIADTTIFDFGEHPDPQLRPLPVTVLTGPQPEDVAAARHRHRERDIDRPVRDVTSRIFTFTASMKITGYPESRGGTAIGPCPRSPGR